MSKIVEYVEKNHRKNISLANTAKIFGYDYFYFSKIFNSIFLMSFNDYLNTYRFNDACQMLIETDMTITEIASESGFKSIRNFNHVFKKLSGASPQEYRNMYTVHLDNSAET